LPIDCRHTEEILEAKQAKISKDTKVYINHECS